MFAKPTMVWKTAGPEVFCVLSMRNPINKENGTNNVTLSSASKGSRPSARRYIYMYPENLRFLFGYFVLSNY